MERPIQISGDPVLESLQKEKEIFWKNTKKESWKGLAGLGLSDMEEAAARMKRFAPFLQSAFPELEKTRGKINSPLEKLENLQKEMAFPGSLLLKMDNVLPVSGSIKARGGFYEVLCHAERLAIEAGLLSPENDYRKLLTLRDFFSTWSISVGSTGNLGLSIGLMGTTLGFQVNVHMSQDAREWKKDLLRKSGARVFEYSEDYSFAVESARSQSASNPRDYFIDDENSRQLFLGYSLAAFEIAEQLEEKKITVDASRPLFVYLPCGVGGGPGGITFGLKVLFGDHVYCFFGEPVQSPAVFLGLYTGLHDKISVGDIGLKNKTIADGLAVGKPSGFVGKILEDVIDGCFTCKDAYLISKMQQVWKTEGIFLEPSAVIGFKGFEMEKPYSFPPSSITHMVWATGGSLVPEEIKKGYLNLSSDTP